MNEEALEELTAELEDKNADLAKKLEEALEANRAYRVRFCLDAIQRVLAEHQCVMEVIENNQIKVKAIQ